MTRADGRAFDQLRPVELTKDYIKFAEGSVLIRCGDTVVLCNASVEEKTPPHVPEGHGWVTAEYSMLPRANRERSKRDIAKLKLSPRSAEIQRLVGRSLRAAVDLGPEHLSCYGLKVEEGTPLWQRRDSENLPGDEAQAETVAKSVISSTLTKAAIFGADANWGRVLCAMGYSGAEFDPETVDVSFASAAGDIAVCEKGRGLPFDETKAKKILTEHDVEILVDLHSGSAQCTCWGCDITYDYIKINGDYRT